MLERGAELALEGDPANRYLPWIVALMVYLAILAVAGAFALGGAAARWQSGQSDRLTIQLPDGDESQSERVITLLLETPGVASARRLERSELVRLLEPWLGEGNIAYNLPLPELIDVAVSRDAGFDLDALSGRLLAIVPGAAIDDHGHWMGRLAKAARTIQILALALLAFIALATTATVAVATRASLAVHRETIELLHLMGAHDRFVAVAFERQALALGLRGGLIGLGLASLTFAILYNVTSGLDAPLLPRLDITPASLATLVVLPLAGAFIAMTTARLTVLRALMKMP